MATTLEAIQAKMRKLQAQADALIVKKSTTVLKTIHELMEKNGLTTADIDAHAGGKQRAKKAGTEAAAKGSASAAKYRDPKTGATWSGHGRAPGWIASVKNRDKFLVDGSTATAKAAPASLAKAAGNYVRGPQPAMYQDPKSGATWSGRGRAPALNIPRQSEQGFHGKKNTNSTAKLMPIPRQKEQGFHAIANMISGWRRRGSTVARSTVLSGVPNGKCQVDHAQNQGSAAVAFRV